MSVKNLNVIGTVEMIDMVILEIIEEIEMIGIALEDMIEDD